MSDARVADGPWLESRTGLASAWQALGRGLCLPVPARAAWAVTLGSVALVFLAVQFATGVLLALYYQPTMDGAHASVRWINSEVSSGWLVRSLHVWGAHAFLLFMLVHLGSQFLRGTYRNPREVTWVVGTLVLLVACGSAFTGQFLPMDQEAYQGGLIAASSAGPLASIVRGGDRIGDPMVGRFFVGHILLLPAALVALIAGHLALVGRHGLTGAPAGTDRRDSTFLRLAGTAALTSLAALVILAVAFPAGVGPKADPTASVAGVKPQWLFLPLYQAMKVVWLEKVLLFGGPVALLSVPFVDRGRSRVPVLAVGVLIAVGVIVLGILGALDGGAAGAPAASGK